ncbi:MAG: hypothetical protein EOO10_08940 [Chitinophagaceae bacterium]|nr:MAG: hypothetical protein EOO10_08940 [Chitinophagaceae bacterium]
MRRPFYFLFFALALVGFTSCQKNDIIADERNIEGTWSVTGITSDRAYDFNGDGRTETDIYGSYSSCGRDIVVVFERNGYGQMRQGCNSSWQNITWSLTNQSLSITLPDDQLNLSLRQFDDYTIRGTDQVNINGTYFNVTYTFQRR